MQKRSEYATGEVIESGVGYTVSVGKPYADGTEVADGEASAVFSYLPNAVADDDIFARDYLVTMEINSVVVAYREMHNYGDTEDGTMLLDYYDYGAKIAIGFGDDGFAVWNADEDNPALAEDDEIRLLIEPVNIKLSPAFRAAVKKAYVAKEPEPVEGLEPIDVNPGDITIEPLG